MFDSQPIIEFGQIVMGIRETTKQIEGDVIALEVATLSAACCAATHPETTTAHKVLGQLQYPIPTAHC
jgi:hypothetical protein